MPRWLIGLPMLVSLAALLALAETVAAQGLDVPTPPRAAAEPARASAGPRAEAAVSAPTRLVGAVVSPPERAKTDQPAATRPAAWSASAPAARRDTPATPPRQPSNGGDGAAGRAAKETAEAQPAPPPGQPAEAKSPRSPTRREASAASLADAALGQPDGTRATAPVVERAVEPVAQAVAAATKPVDISEASSVRKPEPPAEAPPGAPIAPATAPTTIEPVARTLPLEPVAETASEAVAPVLDTAAPLVNELQPIVEPLQAAVAPLEPIVEPLPPDPVIDRALDVLLPAETPAQPATAPPATTRAMAEPSAGQPAAPLAAAAEAAQRPDRRMAEAADRSAVASATATAVAAPGRPSQEPASAAARLRWLEQADPTAPAEPASPAARSSHLSSASSAEPVLAASPAAAAPERSPGLHLPAGAAGVALAGLPSDQPPLSRPARPVGHWPGQPPLTWGTGASSPVLGLSDGPSSSAGTLSLLAGLALLAAWRALQRQALTTPIGVIPANHPPPG